MNLSTLIELPDSAFFSRRAKTFRLFNEQSQQQFLFSNRYSVSSSSETETRLAPIGRGNGGMMVMNENRPGIAAGRGRTTVPQSAFVLQKNDLSSSSTTITPAPIFVMHDEVQFVRPYFGPPESDLTPPLPLSHKRQILLSALKGIETGLKTL